METLKKYAIIMPARAIMRTAEKLDAWCVLPPFTAFLFAVRSDALRAAFSMASQSRIPALALALCVGLWCAKGGTAFVFALLGAMIGSAAIGNFAGGAASLMLIAAHFLTKGKTLHPLYKNAILAAALLLVLPLGAILNSARESSAVFVISHIVQTALCVFLSAVMANAFSGAAAIERIKTPQEAQLVSLAVAVGLMCAAFGSIRPLGISLGALTAAFFALFCAHVFGLASVALAAIVAVLRIFGANLDFFFVAILCTCTLSACLLRNFTRIASALSFLLSALVFRVFLHGTGLIGIFEAAIACAAFLCLPKRFMPAAALFGAADEETLKKTKLQMDFRLNALANALMDISYETTDENSAFAFRSVLSGTANCLFDMTEFTGLRSKRRVKLDFGTYCVPKSESFEAGDTASVRETDGGFIAAISDGMGSGAKARRESLRSIELFEELVQCGFRLDKAAECVNAMLICSDGGEMYATLDAILFDASRGSMSILKQGAPPSFIIRRGRVEMLYAEALPVGITREAKPSLSSAKLLPGDTVIMMSDGVFDALGDEVELAIKSIDSERDPAAAAMMLVELAINRRKNDDDMSVIVSKAC